MILHASTCFLHSPPRGKSLRPSLFSFIQWGIYYQCFIVIGTYRKKHNMKEQAARQWLHAWSDLLQVVQVHGLQVVTGVLFVKVLQVVKERRKEGKQRGRISRGGSEAGRSLAARGRLLVVRSLSSLRGCVYDRARGVMRCRCYASLAARRMICAGCRCKPSAAAAPVVYRWPLYCIRCAAAAADDLKKTL